MAQAKREKIVYGDATEYKEDVKNGLIIPREPSKISDSLAEDVKKGRVVARPGQADTHLAHLSFSQEALLNGTATDKQEEIAKRYYVANIDAINADRKRHGLSPITVEEAVNAAKVVYEVLNNKGKESEELKKDVESGSVIYRRVNKDLEEEVLAKNVENVFITTTTTTTTRISTGPAAAAPGGRGNGRVRRSTTEEAPAPETSGSTETTQNGGTPNKKNKGDQSSETVATELPHVAPDHSSTETGNAGEGARPSNGNGGSSVTPSQPEENKGGTEAPAPVQPPSQPEDSVVTPTPETNPVQPEAPVENTPTPEPPAHVETEEEKLAKYTENDFDGSNAGWYDVENPETYYQLLPADCDMRLAHGKTYRLVAWNTVTSRAEYVEVKHPKDLLSEHVHANSTDYAIRPQDKPVPGGPYKYILTIDWNTLNELDDNAQLHEYTSGLYYVSNEDLIPIFHHTKGLKWYDFDNVATTYDVDDNHETSYLTSEFKIDVRKTGTEEIVVYTMPILSEVFTQKVEYDGKTYWIRPQDNYTDEEHVKDIVMLDASKLNPALTNNIGAVNEAFTVVSNRVLHVETDEEKLAKYHQEDFSSSHMWYNLDNVHVMYTLHNDDLHKVIERGKSYKLAMWNTETNKAEFVEFKHIADVFTETVHANEIDYCVRPQDVYVEGDEGKDIVVYEKSSYDTMPDQTLETMVGIVYQSHTANLAPTVYTYENGFKWYDLNDPSHVYLVPDTYAYNNLLENLEITVKDTATNSEIKMTIPNPNTVFTEEVEYNGETYVIRPQDIYFEGGTEKNVVITKKSMIIGFAVYMQSVLINTIVISNKALANTESSTTEDPVVNGKKLSEYTEAEFDSATTYFDLEAPADVNGTLYTLRADADKPFDLNTAHDLVMMEASSKKVKLVHIDPILTTFTHEVKTQSELDIMLRPQDAYVNGVTRDVVYIDKAVKDEARTVATFMHYVSTDSMTNLKPYEAPSNTETTPGSSEATPTPVPEEADPIIHGKRLSEYNSTNFNRSYVYVNYNEDMSSNNYNDFSYFLTLDAINTPLERGKTYDFAMMNINTNQIKVIHMDDPYATFTKESKTVSRSNILLRPQDEYVKGDERYIPFLIKETFDTASTIGDYCNALAVEPSDSLKPDISENYFTDHEFHITSVQSEGYCVAKGDENTIPVPGHTYHLYNISTQEAEDMVFPDIKNTYDTVNIGRQKYYYKPEYKVTDPRAVEGDADMYAYLGETIDNPSSTWLDIMISQRRVPRTITYIEPKLPEVPDTIDTTVYYDKPWFSIVPYDLSTRLYIKRDELSTNPAPQYDKQDIFTVWNAKTNAESTEYISHLGSNVFGPFDVKGESCYVFKASDDYSTVNNLEDLGVGRNIVTIPARIMEKININDYQSITWKDILDNVKLIYTGDLY